MTSTQHLLAFAGLLFSVVCTAIRFGVSHSGVEFATNGLSEVVCPRKFILSGGKNSCILC